MCKRQTCKRCWRGTSLIADLSLRDGWQPEMGVLFPLPHIPIFSVLVFSDLSLWHHKMIVYPDTSYPDTSYPDTSYPDTSYPDTSYPDTSYQLSSPDTSYPDTSSERLSAVELICTTRSRRGHMVSSSAHQWVTTTSTHPFTWCL